MKAENTLLLYDREITQDFNAISKEHQKVINWVGHNQKVVEFACHTGYVSSWLQKNGCEVTGAEINEKALEKAKPYLHRAIPGNIEHADVWNKVAEEKYNFVLFMHILEHLVDPYEILLKTKNLLLPGGQVIICLPNISNWDDRYLMLKGGFNYTETGVMDKTHLRFYNYFTAQELIKSAGYKIEEYCGDSWKIRFKIFKDTKTLSYINDYYNRFVHKVSSPNLTDKITMFRISIA